MARRKGFWMYSCKAGKTQRKDKRRTPPTWQRERQALIPFGIIRWHHSDVAKLNTKYKQGLQPKHEKYFSRLVNSSHERYWKKPNQLQTSILQGHSGISDSRNFEQASHDLSIRRCHGALTAHHQRPWDIKVPLHLLPIRSWQSVMLSPGVIVVTYMVPSPARRTPPYKPLSPSLKEPPRLKKVGIPLPGRAVAFHKSFSLLNLRSTWRIIPGIVSS